MRRASIILALALFGCAADVGDIRLADVDLSDAKVVERLSRRMDPDERQAFTTYVVAHFASSASFCGRPLVGPQGQEPVTIREAIELTRFRQAQQPVGGDLLAVSTREDQIIRQWHDLISKRDLLIDRQTLLRAQNGASAERLSEWKSIQVEMADLDRQLLELKPQFLAAGGV